MLIIEIMGKHSNVILVDPASMHIIDSIKRLSFDINRVRQVLPGKKYQYPPKQDKLPFDKVDKDFLEKRTGDDKQLLDSIMGISPLVARMMAPAPWKILTKMQQDLENGNLSPAVYLKPDKTPADFHIFPVKEYQGMYEFFAFTTVSYLRPRMYEDWDTADVVENAAMARLLPFHLKKQALANILLLYFQVVVG